MRAYTVLIAISACCIACGGDPATLAETGLYADDGSLAPGVQRYTPRFELWSDGATKQRYLHVPDGTTIDETNADGWIYPVGTKAWKEFTRDGVRVETRLLEKIADGEWSGVAYVWDAEQAEAVATPGGADDALGTAHDVPSSEQCGACHGRMRDTLIGVSAVLLDDQIALPGDAVAQRALGYLHANCGGCHNARNDDNPLRLWLTVDGLATVEDTTVYQTAVGQTTHTDPLDGTDATEIIAPGDPAASLLYLRMVRRGDGQMPPVGTEEVDEPGAAAVAAWIESLAP